VTGRQLGNGVFVSVASPYRALSLAVLGLPKAQPNLIKYRKGCDLMEFKYQNTAAGWTIAIKIE